jgi:hypothetical protein
MKLAGNLIKFSWIVIFVWTFGGVVLGRFFPPVLRYLPKGVFAVFGIALLALLTLLWGVLKLYQSGMSKAKH